MKHYAFLIAILFATAIFVACKSPGITPQPIKPIPEPSQVAWQKMETTAFVHFGLNTFNNREWGYGDSDPNTFNPTNLDCNQWAQTFVKAGIKEVIITAKHHDGFCLWPTDQNTDYNIRLTPYKNGKGDIVGELSAACKKYGLEFGVYLSPWDRHQASYSTPEYLNYFHKQLTELLTNYGKISEVWFDGANGGDGWYGGKKEERKIDRKTYYNFPYIFQLVYSYQPDAIIYSDGGPGCRWIGNESGIAGATNWSFLRSKEVYPGYDKYYELTNGHIDGDKWVPGECDVSIRPGWFYHPEEDSKVKSVDDLVELYYQSVGHNGLFLLNFPADREGRIHSTDSINAIRYHEQIQRELKTDLLAGIKPTVTNSRGTKFSGSAVTDSLYDTYWATKDDVTKATITFKLSKATKMNRLMLQEYIPLGQRVSSFIIEYFNGKEWLAVNPHEETTTIGYKRIVRFETITTNRIRVRFLNARGSICINRIAAFYSGNDNAFSSVKKMDDFYTLPFVLKDMDEQEVSKTTDHDNATLCSVYSDEIVIDLKENKKVHELDLLPDQSSKRTGLISNYQVFTADNSLANRKLIAEGEFSNIKNNPVWQHIYFTPVTTRYVILKASRMIDNATSINLAELRIK